MTVRPFKGDELMCDKYCDVIHYGNPTSLITLRRNEYHDGDPLWEPDKFNHFGARCVKIILEQLLSRVFCTC